MAEIRILTPQELAARDQKPKRQGRSGRQRSPERTRIIEEYKAALRQTRPGFAADVSLADTEDKRIVRFNLKEAASDLNLALDFRPIKDKNRLHFRVITQEEHEAKPKRGGRPRKTGAAPAEVTPAAAAPEETPRPRRPRQRQTS